MRLMLGVSVLALGIVVGGRAFARDGQGGSSMSSGMTSSSSMTGSVKHSTDWSHQYKLTPVEHKRLHAMGLADKEVYAVANAARESGRSVDEVAQMVLRGRSFWQIARELGLPYKDLEHRQPEWDTPEWKHAVDEGWYTLEQGTTMPGSSTRSTTRS